MKEQASDSYRVRAKRDRKFVSSVKRTKGKWILDTGRSTWFCLTKKKRAQLIVRLKAQDKLKDGYREINPT